MEVGTIQDACDDIMQSFFEKLEAEENPMTFLTSKSLPHRIVHSGVGSISLHDVVLAKAANRIIVSYDVQDIEKHALSEIQVGIFHGLFCKEFP